MARREDRNTVVEFGVQTPNSRTVLTVTQDLAEAEHMLDMLGGGRLVRRSVSYSSWRPVEPELALPDETLPVSNQDSTPSAPRLVG